VTDSEYDVIIVGSGASGATLARDLARRRLKVLLLERGGGGRLSETAAGIAMIAEEFPVADDMKATTGVTVGGSTGLYFGICKLPTAATYAKLGIDLSKEVAQVSGELPIAHVSDDFLPPQSIIVRDSAQQLGYPMKTHLMLLDKARCEDGRYSYESKWKARQFIDEATRDGAELVDRATVSRVIVEGGRAVGVEYRRRNGLFGSQACRAYARRIVLSAGSPATPKLLIGAGIGNVGSRGFFCKPAFMVFGSIAGLKGRDGFLGMTECDLGNGVTLGDGAMASSLFKLFMLSNGKLGRLFSHATTVSVAVALNDELGGEVRRDGSYHKRLAAEEVGKLKAAEGLASRILAHAGATKLFRSKSVAGTPGGVLWVGEHLDDDLQTAVDGLYVCDQSVMPDVTVTPTVLLIALATRLAAHLARSLQPGTAAGRPIVEKKAPMREFAGG
jgi:hypothetical protein